MMRFFQRQSEVDEPSSRVTESALAVHTELPMVDEKEDLNFLQRNLQNKKRLMIISGAGLAVVACAAAVIATATRGVDSASMGSAQNPDTPPPTTTAPAAETSVSSTGSETSSDVVAMQDFTNGTTQDLINATLADGVNATNSSESVSFPEVITESASIDQNTTKATETPEPTTETPAPTTTSQPTPEPTTAEPTTTAPPPTTTAPTPPPTTKPPATTPPPPTQPPATPPPATPAPPPPSSGDKPNDNGSGLWGGSIRLINNLPKACIYTDKTATYFTTGNGRGDLATGQSVTLGPFGGVYTLGVQENVFAKCAYAGTCAWDNKSADNYCYNFSLDKNCGVKWNDCPWPTGNPSPAPDGRKRYSISGAIKDGVCVLSVSPIGSGACNGGADCYCDAKW
ncbi:hypothetical protein AeNC1_016467 [Aphanomyces euteiches]|nr:hypothetical protein AeNC1_016467 [Aphanomyces euteiches]